jgi:hypothetical protein
LSPHAFPLQTVSKNWGTWRAPIFPFEVPESTTKKGRYYFLLQQRGEEKNVMGVILVVILVIVLIGALPTWRHSKSWGPYPSGGIGLVLLILIILLLLGHI